MSARARSLGYSIINNSCKRCACGRSMAAPIFVYICIHACVNQLLKFKLRDVGALECACAHM